MQLTDKPGEIHTLFLDHSINISAELTNALRALGPVTFPDRPDRGLGYQLARSVVGQQISAKAARAIWKRIETSATKEGQKIPAFFENKRENLLRTCGISRNKVKALIAIQNAYNDGYLDAKKLLKLDHKSRSEELNKIWGVGQWTCDMASIFYFRSPDIWPESDSAVQKTFTKFIGTRDPSSTASNFSPYRSYLALAMWRILDGMPQE